MDDLEEDYPLPDNSPRIRVTIGGHSVIDVTLNQWLALEALMGRTIRPFKSFAQQEPEAPDGILGAGVSATGEGAQPSPKTHASPARSAQCNGGNEHE